MKPVDLSVSELLSLVNCLKYSLGVERPLAVIMICRMIADFSDDDVQRYGTHFEEAFNDWAENRN